MRQRGDTKGVPNQAARKPARHRVSVEAQDFRAVKSEHDPPRAEGAQRKQRHEGEHRPWFR